MGTTSADLAQRVLDELERVEPAFVVLHGEDDLSNGRVASDVDVAVVRDPRAVVAAVSRPLADDGVAPIMLWPYDRNSLTIFWSDSDGDRGVQLDLVCDPLGQGRYGFRTGELIARAERGERWPRLDTEDELLYLIRKRQVKRNATETVRLLSSMPMEAKAALADRARQAFSESAGKQIVQMISSGAYVDPKGAAFDRRLRNVASNPGFYGTRLRQKVGAWVSVSGATLAEIDVALAPLRGLLPAIIVREGVRTRANARPHQLRARLLVTADHGRVDRRADVGVDGSVSPGELRRAVVAGLAGRLAPKGGSGA